MDLNLVRREGTMDLWLELEDVKKGAIHLKLNWLGFSENPADLKTALIESQNLGLASCLLTVRLDSAKNLPVFYTTLIPFINYHVQIFMRVSFPDALPGCQNDHFVFLLHKGLEVCVSGVSPSFASLLCFVTLSLTYTFQFGFRQ